VHARERERVFSRAWTYAGPAEWVSEPGSYFAAQIGYVPVAVVRGSDGMLRGLVNVCRHRGHLVVEGTGCRETLQCPYHAWTYDLDGTLRRAPRSDREPGFDPEGLSLESVSVGTWGPFVFVNPDAEAVPLEAALGRLPEIVATSGLDLDAIRFHSHHEWPIEANWKVVLENFLECYHCPTAHPGFSKVIDVSPDAYVLQVHPTFSSQIGSARPAGFEGNGGAELLPRGDVAQSQYHFIFPSTTLNIAPGIANISLERYNPDSLGRTTEVTDYYFGADVSDAEIEELMAWDHQVAEEDVSLVQSVQRGLESGAVPQGRLMAESEQLIADFQRRVHDALVSD
jgi:phenylpropionate dioxygenase-like ring-hydroxylating dioxygenase large terminal subunit